MRELREQVTLKCPVEDAESRVLAFFAGRRAADGTLRMRLRVPAGSESRFNYSISRLVRVEAKLGKDEDDLNEVIKVSWRPEGTAMLPQFEGKLTVWGDDDLSKTVLELDGRYLPPFGIAGQVFDEAIGQQIAHATAAEFLSDIKRWVDAPPGSALDVGRDV